MNRTKAQQSCAVLDTDLVSGLVGLLPDPDRVQSRLNPHSHKVVGQCIHRLIPASIALNNEHLHRTKRQLSWTGSSKTLHKLIQWPTVNKPAMLDSHS